MITIKKPLCLIMSLFLCLSTLCIPLLSAEIHVYDHANLFSLDEVEKLETASSQLAEDYQMDIGIVTTDDAEGQSSQDYADTFYDNNGFGYGSQKDGLLFLIDMDNREIYISTSGSGIKYFTDLRVSKMLDSAYNYISNGDYYGTAKDFLSQTQKYLKAGIPNNQYTTNRPYSDPREDYNNPYIQDAPSSHKPFTTRSGQPLNGVSILLSIIVSLIGSGIIAFIVRSLVAYSYKKPRYTVPATRPNDLSVRYTQREDRFVSTHTSRVRIQSNNNGGSGGGGASGRSSVHSSGGGGSHGGGGRSF